MAKPPIPPSGYLLKIRLSRGGTKHRPEFFINVAQAYRRRDCKFVENLGKFEVVADPIDGAKRIYLNFERIKYWLGRGAKPTFRVAWLLGKANIIPSVPRGIYFRAGSADNDQDGTMAHDIEPTGQQPDSSIADDNLLK